MLVSRDAKVQKVCRPKRNMAMLTRQTHRSTPDYLAELHPALCPCQWGFWSSFVISIDSGNDRWWLWEPETDCLYESGSWASHFCSRLCKASNLTVHGQRWGNNTLCHSVSKIYNQAKATPPFLLHLSVNMEERPACNIQSSWTIQGFRRKLSSG